MRYLAAILLALLPAMSAADEAEAPPDATIIIMAQYYMQEEYMTASHGHYGLEFDVAYVMPQPEPNYWAVVGGFVSHANTRNIYVAAMRLVCDEIDEVECWRLEKLGINRTVVYDRGDPL